MTGFYMKCNAGLKWVKVKKFRCMMEELTIFLIKAPCLLNIICLMPEVLWCFRGGYIERLVALNGLKNSYNDRSGQPAFCKKDII